MDRPRPERPASRPLRALLSAPFALALTWALALGGAACADSAASASLSAVMGADGGGPALVAASSCEEAEAAVRAQAKASLRLETARLRQAVLEGRLLPGASPPARAQSPLTPTGGVAATTTPRAPSELSARVGRIAVVADRVYAVTPHGLHIVPRPVGEEDLTVDAAFVPITGDAWGVVASGPWALVLSSVVSEVVEGGPAPGASAPPEVVVLTRVDAADLSAPRVVYEEALDGHAYAARADGGGASLVVSAPWRVPGTAATPEGLSPDATEAEVLAAFDALDARNDAAVDAAPFGSLMPQRRGVLWSGALDPTSVRPATSCAALYYPAGLAGSEAGPAGSASSDGAPRGALSVGAAVTYVVTVSAAPTGGSREARVQGALVGDWHHAVWGVDGVFLGAAAELLDGAEAPSDGEDAAGGDETLVARVGVGAATAAESESWRLQAVALVAGAPLGERALAPVEGGRLLVATALAGGGARLTVLSAGRAEARWTPSSLAVWGTWVAEGAHGGAAVVHTDGARAYVQPSDPREAVAVVSLADPGGEVGWLGAGSGCAWVGLLPQRDGRLVALRRCGEDGARLSWASFELGSLGDAGDLGTWSAEATPVVTGVAVEPKGGEAQDWTDIIWAQQSLWPLDSVGLIGVPVTTRIEEEGGWSSVRSALALFRSSEGGVKPAGLIVHPSSPTQESARMLDARERDGQVWSLSAAGLGATPVPGGAWTSPQREGSLGARGEGMRSFVGFDCQ